MGRFGGQTFEDARADPALRLGLACGGVATLAALIGYVLVPWAASGEWNVFGVIVGVAIGTTRIPLWRHVAVLVAVPLALALGGTLLARRRGLDGRAADATVVGGVVIVPVLAVVGLYAVSAVGYGMALGSGPATLAERLGFGLAFTLWSLLFGFLALIVWLVIVVVAESLGAVAGYLLARGIVRLTGRRESTTATPTDGE